MIVTNSPSCKVYLYRFARVGSSGPVRVLHLLHNKLDTIEAFIAETYVQLAATESMCYFTSSSALTDGFSNSKHHTVLCGALNSYSCRR